MKRIKYIILIISVILLFGLFPLSVCAEQGEIDTPNEVEKLLGKSAEDYISEGGDVFSAVTKAIKQSFPSLFTSLFSLVATLAVSAVLNAVCSLSPSSSSAYSLASRTCCALMVFDTVKSTCLCVKTALDTMVVVMSSFLGIMCVTGVTSQQVISASSHATIVLTSLHLISGVCSRAVMPVVYASFALSLASSMSDTPDLSGPINAFKKLAVTLLSAACGLFSFCLTLQSVALTSFEQAVGRGVRFAAASFIPIIGSSLSEATSYVIEGMKTIRSLSCTSALLVLLLVLVVPLCMIICNKLSLSLASLCAGVLSLDGEKKLLDGINSLLTILLSALLSCFTVLVVSCATFMKFNYA